MPTKQALFGIVLLFASTFCAVSWGQQPEDMLPGFAPAPETPFIMVGVAEIPKDTVLFDMLKDVKTASGPIDLSETSTATINLLSFIQIDEKGKTPQLGKPYIAYFNAILDNEKGKCVDEKAPYSKEELLRALADPFFMNSFSSYQSCMQYIHPEADHCDFQKALKDMENVKAKSGFMSLLPPDKNYAAAANEIMKNFRSNCAKEVQMLFLISGKYVIDGKPLAKYICDFNNLGSSCVDSFTILVNALENNDSRRCADYKNNKESNPSLTSICLAITMDDTKFCIDESPYSEAGCRSKYYAYKAIHENNQKYLLEDDVKYFTKFLPLIKAYFNPAACNNFHDDQLYIDFCGWKYKPTNYDMAQYFSKDIKFLNSLFSKLNGPEKVK